MGIEPTALAAGAKVVAAIAPKGLSLIASSTKVAIDKLRARYSITFEDHLNKTLNRIENVKTVISKDTPVPLKEIYVHLTLKSDAVCIEDSDLIPVYGRPIRHFIYGTGGAGKTMLLKYLLMSSITDPRGLIPIFLEFRSLGLHDHATVEAAAFAKVAADGANESFDLFVEGLAYGIFAIFIDGLDETAGEDREDILEKLSSFSNKFQNTSITISSRPGFSPQALETYTAYRVRGLSLEQALEVVSKTRFDEDLKEEFKLQLKEILYKKHQTFLKVPLLVTMMLLTFGSYADIPERMTVFYEQAFETLYALHDTSSKGTFKRPHFAKLSPDVFRRSFEAFCYITLSKSRFDFIYADLMDYISKALKVSNVETEPFLYLRDLEESVCLIQQDGVKYVFAHRSFQEYFAAKFALRYGGANQFDIITNCIGRDWGNNTINMLREIDETKFREKWLLPALEKVHNHLQEDRKKPFSDRIKLLARSVYLSSTEDGTVGAVGIPHNSSVTDLSIPISRVCDIPNSFDSVSGSKVYPSEFSSFEDFLRSDDVPTALQEFRDNLTHPGKRIPPNSVEINLETSDVSWLELTDLPDRVDRFYRSIETELVRVRSQVEAQQKLELEVL